MSLRLWFLLLFTSPTVLSVDICNFAARSNVPYAIDTCMYDGDNFKYICLATNNQPQRMEYGSSADCAASIGGTAASTVFTDFVCDQSVACAAMHVTVVSDITNANEDYEVCPFNESDFNVNETVYNSFAYAIDVCFNLVDSSNAASMYSCTYGNEAYSVDEYSTARVFQCGSEDLRQISTFTTECSDTSVLDNVANQTYVDILSCETFATELENQCPSADMTVTMNGAFVFTDWVSISPFKQSNFRTTIIDWESSASSCTVCNLSDCTPVIEGIETYTDQVIYFGDGVSIDGNCTTVEWLAEVERTLPLTAGYLLHQTHTDSIASTETAMFATVIRSVTATTPAVTAISGESVVFECGSNGFPSTICISIDCSATKTLTCGEYHGIYRIDTSAANAQNDNPIWLKSSYGLDVISAKYIYLHLNASASGVASMFWVLSSVDPSLDAYDLWCSSGGDIPREPPQDFNCDWQNGSLSVEVASDPSSNCDDSLSYICIASFASNAVLTQFIGGVVYYNFAQSNIYVSTDVSQSTYLQQQDIYRCSDASAVYSLEAVLNSEVCTLTAYLNVWAFIDGGQLLAFCTRTTDTELDSNPQLCTEWMTIQNVSASVFAMDSSFDIDLGDCSVDTSLTDYPSTLCIQPPSRHYVTHSQYLWDEWRIQGNASHFDTYHNHRYYYNPRLQSSKYISYLIYFDPKDTWIMVTTGTAALLASDIFLESDFKAICMNTSIHYPTECEVWKIDNATDSGAIFVRMNDMNGSNVTANSVTECFSEGVHTEQPKKKDLCISFDTLEKLDSESTVALVHKVVIPLYYIRDKIEGNAIYLIQPQVVNERSVWKKADGKIAFYVYYHAILRYWVWSDAEPAEYAVDGDLIVEGNDSNGTGTAVYLVFEFDAYLDSWCLEYTDDFPSQCEQFYYTSDVNDEIVNVTAVLEDCTVNTSNLTDWVGYIVTYTGIACFGCLLLICVLAFYRERRRKKLRVTRRNSLYAKSKRRLSNIGAGSVDPIEEEEEEAPQPEKGVVVSVDTADANAKLYSSVSTSEVGDSNNTLVISEDYNDDNPDSDGRTDTKEKPYTD